MNDMAHWVYLSNAGAIMESISPAELPALASWRSTKVKDIDRANLASDKILRIAASRPQPHARSVCARLSSHSTIALRAAESDRGLLANLFLSSARHSGFALWRTSNSSQRLFARRMISGG